ncbi:MAG: sigma-E factor regulatory protein RseB domain-containing protein [Gallionella sp.]
MASLLIADPGNPIQSAIAHYQDVASYQAIVKSSRGGKTEIMRYYFMNPGYVRMEFIKPFNGAVLIYDPASRQARLWPFGYRSFPAFTLSPENRLIQSTTGQRVDRSDVGALFRNVQALQEHGRTEVVGIEPVSGKETVHVMVEGNQAFSVETVHRYQLWLDQTTGFPLKISSHDAAGQLIEMVEMGELQINPRFPDDLFNQ